MENIVTKSESELLYMIRCGSFEALQLLSNKYERIITSYAVSYIQDSRVYGIELADLIEECLITFYSVLKLYDERKGSFYTFIMKCIRFRIYDLIKMASNNKNLGFIHSSSFSFIDFNTRNIDEKRFLEEYYANDEFIHPQNGYYLQETVTNIFGEDSVLNKKEKQIIAMRVMGYTIDEIGEKFKIGKRKVDYIIKTAKNKITFHYIK